MTTLKPQPTPKSGTEKQTLTAILRNNRAAIAWKLEGLSDEDAARPMVFSGTNLLGLVKHLAWVELGWFVEFFAGEPVDDPYAGKEDADMRPEPGETVESIIDLYERHVARADAVIEAADLDQLSAGDHNGERFTLRWILAHMIEETARHAGHADILREQIDGVTGLYP
ncbi:MAG TPA: DinB family protein [Jiangellaceae bacterium]|nr:DinB family protein [Jiangellaceae bacterium]